MAVRDEQDHEFFGEPLDGLPEGWSTGVPPDASWADMSGAPLEELFVEWVADATLPTTTLAWRFVMHEESTRAMYGAVGTAVARFDLRGDFDDIASAARIDLMSAFSRHRNMKYVPGKAPFGAWLHTLWKNAVSNACRRPLRDRRRYVSGREALDDIPSGSSLDHTQEAEEMEDHHALQKAVIDLPPGRLRDVMLDLVSGLSGVESARMRNVTTGRVAQLRKEGLKRLRSKFGVTLPGREG